MNGILLNELRAGTKDLHIETEKLLFPNPENITQSRYQFFLNCNLLFHQYYEPEVSRRYFTSSREWKAFDRSRLKNLYQDTRNLDITSLSPDENNPFKSWSDMNMLGAAYVSEGSTLGSQMILKLMRKQLFFDVERNGRFLSANGRNTGDAWKLFLRLLEKEGQNAKHEVVLGAKQAFEHFSSIARKLEKQDNPVFAKLP